MRCAAVIAALSLALVGCSAEEEASPPPPPETSAEEPEPEPDRCIAVPGSLLEGLATGLTVTGGGSLRDGWAVKSTAFENIYFVSAEIDGPGIESDGDIGTWTTNDPVAGGAHFSVNTAAKEFSDWGDGGATDAAFSMEDDGAEASQDCVESN